MASPARPASPPTPSPGASHIKYPQITREQVRERIEPIVCPACGARSSPDTCLTRVGRYYMYRRVHSVQGTFRGGVVEDDDSEECDDPSDRYGFTCFECNHDWGISDRVNVICEWTVQSTLCVDSALGVIARTHHEIEGAVVADVRADDLVVETTRIFRIIEATSGPESSAVRVVNAFKPDGVDNTPVGYSWAARDRLRVFRPNGPPPGLAEDLVSYLKSFTGIQGLGTRMSRFEEAGIRAEMERTLTPESVDLFFSGFTVHRELRWHLLRVIGAPPGDRAIDL